jgi:hypothetical protein
MHRLPIVIAALSFSGCDLNPEKAADFFTGRETNVVVLAKQPVMLRPEVATLTSQEPMKVLGEWTSLCFALKSGMPLQDSKQMDRAFEEAMQSAKVRVYLTLTNGDRVALRQPLQAWSMGGTILGRDELSACASTPCKAELPVGAQVAKVEVSSEPPLQVQGVFWKSEKGPLEKPVAPSAQAATASAPKGPSSCSA